MARISVALIVFASLLALVDKASGQPTPRDFGFFQPAPPPSLSVPELDLGLLGGGLTLLVGGLLLLTEPRRRR